MARYLLQVMYDGMQFHGSQLQGDIPTVQRALNNTLSTVFRQPILTFGASRTDEGVHALSNYYHFDVDVDFGFDLIYKCNAILPDGVAILTLKEVGPDFNARFDALSRTYRYRIYTHKNPFLLHRALFYPYQLNENHLHETAAIIKEYTHFESFSKRNTQSKTFTCQIIHSQWERTPTELHYVVKANRFLRGMVRGLVATQLHIARGKVPLTRLRAIIEAQDCTQAFFDVPGHGLYLEKISYPE